MADQQQDVLLRYCLALDAGNFDDLGKVLEMAQKDEGLEAALSGIHARFDSSESWVQQLQAYRQQMSEVIHGR